MGFATPSGTEHLCITMSAPAWMGFATPSGTESILEHYHHKNRSNCKMFQRLYDLSSFLSANQEPWQRINEGMPAEYNRGFAIHFSKDGQWLGIETNHLTENEFHPDVVYRSGPSNGTDYTPCCKYVSDTTANRLLKALKKLVNYPKLSEKKYQQLQASIEGFTERQDEIWQAVKNKITSSDIDGKGKRAFVYWKIDSQAVYDWQETKAFLVEQFLDSLATGIG